MKSSNTFFSGGASFGSRGASAKTYGTRNDNNYDSHDDYNRSSRGHSYNEPHTAMRSGPSYHTGEEEDHDEEEPAESESGRPLGQDFIGSQPISIQERIHSLQSLHRKRTAIMSEYEKEAFQLEKKYFWLVESLYGQRNDVVNMHGDRNDTYPSLSSPPAYDWNEGQSAGIPGFWLRAIKNQPDLCDLILPQDEDLLHHLVDIRLGYPNDDHQMGFRLYFEFSKNEYFENETLMKEYKYKIDEGSGEDDGDEEVYAGEMIYDEVKGDEILWKSGHNMTLDYTKMNSHGGFDNVEEAQIPSFFRFFNPPTAPTETGDDEKDRIAMDDYDWLFGLDFEFGEDFKDKLVPFAVHWYTGEATLYEEEDEEEEDEDDENAEGASGHGHDGAYRHN